MAIKSSHQSKENPLKMEVAQINSLCFSPNQFERIEDFVQSLKEGGDRINNHKALADDFVINTIRRKIIDIGEGNNFYEFICRYYIHDINNKWLKKAAVLARLSENTKKINYNSYLRCNKSFYDLPTTYFGHTVSKDWTTENANAFFMNYRANLSIDEFKKLVLNNIKPEYFQLYVDYFIRFGSSIFIWNEDNIAEIIDLGFDVKSLSDSCNVLWSMSFINKFKNYFDYEKLLKNTNLIFDLGQVCNIDSQKELIKLGWDLGKIPQDRDGNGPSLKPYDFSTEFKINYYKYKYASVINPLSKKDIMDDIGNIDFESLYDNPLAPVDWDMYFSLYDSMPIKKHYWTPNVYNKVFKPLLNDYILESVLPIILYKE